jgi:chromosome segregation ATPase
MTLFNSLRESNSKEEAEWEAKLSASEALVSELSSQVDHLSASVASTTKHINLLREQFMHRESVMEEQEIVWQETLKLNQQIDAHRNREMELKRLIAQAHGISETHSKELEKIKKKMSDIDLLRTNNDEEEQALTLLRVDLPKIEAMNDGLSREIASFQENMTSEIQSNQSELSSIENHLKDTSKQVIEKMHKVQEARRMLEENQSLLRELNKETLEEVEQHRNLKVNFDAAYETQLKLILRREMDIAKVRTERLEAKKLERLSEEISLEKLKCGVQIIQEAERIEKEYLEKIKHLQEVV